MNGIVVDGVNLVTDPAGVLQFGYLHGIVGEGPPMHYIFEYWVELGERLANYRVVAACTSFEAAMAAGRLVAG